MNKKITILFLSLLATLMSSCQKDDSYTDQPESKSILVTCSYGDETKTTLADDGLTPLWKVGDQIIIYYGTSDAVMKSYPVELLACDSPYAPNKGVISSNGREFSFEFTISIEKDTHFFGIYPATITATADVSGGKNPSITLNLPSDGRDGQFSSANISVAHKKISSVPDAMKLDFKNAAAIIKIDQTSTACQYESVQYNAGEGVAISGQFVTSFELDGETITSVTPIGESKTSNIFSGNLVQHGISYYAVIPATTGEDAILKLKDKISSEYNVEKHYKTQYTLRRNTINNLKIPGRFSVSDTKTVNFSNGNLWWGPKETESDASFHFEDNQWNYNESWEPKHVSHFFWSKTASVAYAETYSDSGVAPNDLFFTNATATTPNSSFTVEGQTGKWRTLSEDEWTYLLTKREGNSYAKAMVNGVIGLIIFPDSYIGPIPTTGIAEINKTDDDFPQTSIPTEWPSMETYGCVFLPTTGFRDGKFIDYFDRGLYWSSPSIADNTAYDIFFNSGNVIPNDYSMRNNGFAVRLVQ